MSVIRQTVSGVGITTGSGLDEVFGSAYEMDKQPGEVRADDSLFFRQGETDWLVHQYAESMGPGQFRVTVEDEEVDDATVRVGNRTAAEVFEFDRDIAIPQRYQEASEAYGMVEEWVYELGVRARTSRDEQAFRRSYSDAFSGVTTPDGAALEISALMLKSILNNLLNCGKVLRRIIRSQIQQWRGSETIIQASFLDGGIVRSTAII